MYKYLDNINLNCILKVEFAVKSESALFFINDNKKPKSIDSNQQLFTFFVRLI